MRRHSACFGIRQAELTFGTLWPSISVADSGFELSENARLLATLNLAIADAAISCWDAKYFYEFWRPVTAIRLDDADGDGNPDDPNWTPLVVTPAFPEYTSGHSSVAGAAATVLVDYFGEDTPFVLESQEEPNRVRYYPNFTSALDRGRRCPRFRWYSLPDRLRRWRGDRRQRCRGLSSRQSDAAPPRRRRIAGATLLLKRRSCFVKTVGEVLPRRIPSPADLYA